MKNKSSNAFKFSILLGLSVIVMSFVYQSNNHNSKFPFKKAGLSEREAAAHLLSRFTFGATSNQVDEVVKMGIDKWFAQQLNGKLNDDSLNLQLNSYDALKMSNAEIVEKFPRGPKVQRMAIAEGYINKDSVDKGDRAVYRQQLAAFLQSKNLKPEGELFRQLINQKILRATFSNNQLQEVLTDFWFNHFNVSLTKPDCAQFVLAYERDNIRPNVFGKFQDLLMSTATSPAMLIYLDNFSSAGSNTAFDGNANIEARKFANASMDTSLRGQKVMQKLQQAKKAQGLNENYAREIMELHTLGVDGGYTQLDVTQAAKVLTGWTVYPFSDYGPVGNMKKAIERFGEDKLTEKGFIHNGDFLFAINRHDDKEKTVLGKKFAAGGGYNEGVELLTMLAHHPSTAKFICKKLATRFVSDVPSQTIVDKMTKTFLQTDGDIKKVLLTMVEAPEFWSKDALREKTKSPFELAISTVRSLDATVVAPFQLNNWITKMGQQIYYYQAPTGFPDKGQYWINTGSLLNRMNFGLAIANKKIPGIQFNLAALNNNHEPESAEAALAIYSKLLMPERDINETVKRLTPLLADPNLLTKINDAASKTTPANSIQNMLIEEENPSNANMKQGKFNKKGYNNKEVLAMNSPIKNIGMLNQVVGVIIGSPEYQRR